MYIRPASRASQSTNDWQRSNHLYAHFIDEHTRSRYGVLLEEYKRRPGACTVKLYPPREYSRDIGRASTRDCPGEP